MPRRYSVPVILGALALIPLGIAAASVAVRTIVEPVAEALPGSLVLAAQDLVGGESGCGSHSSIFFGGTKHPEAKAFLDRNPVGIEHLYIDASRDDRESPDHAYQARTVPVFEHGACQGVRFSDVAPRSVYAHLGIRTGDVIRRVDGHEIDSPEQALEIYSKLLHQRRVEVEVERNGRPSLNVYKLD